MYTRASVVYVDGLKGNVCIRLLKPMSSGKTGGTLCTPLREILMVGYPLMIRLYRGNTKGEGRVAVS